MWLQTWRNQKPGVLWYWRTYMSWSFQLTLSVLGHAPISLYITTTNNHRQHRTMLLFSSERPATKAQLTGFSDLNSAHFKFTTSSESLDSESGCHWLEEGVVPVRLRWWQAVWWEGSVCWHRDSESLCCVFLSGRAWTSPSLSALKHQNQTHNIKKIVLQSIIQS